MQEKCLIYIEKILKVADFFLNLVKFLLNPPILFLVDKRGCKIVHLCGLIIAFLLHSCGNYHPFSRNMQKSFAYVNYFYYLCAKIDAN